jgi:hypothetical protein
MEKYRDEDGHCTYCGSDISQMHLDTCLVRVAAVEHSRLVREVFSETARQMRLWGVQEHPFGTSPDTRPFEHTDINLDLRTGRQIANIFRNRCDSEHKRGKGTWAHILMEEFGETLAENPGEALEGELVQLAAVAVSMAAASRRARA